jgi:hypothetical protein
VSDVPIFRDFDAEQSESESIPISFKLGGEEFHVITPVPVGMVLVAAKNALTRPDDPVSQAAQATMLWSFVVPEEHDTLDKAVSKITDPSLIQKIFEYILTAAASRPTQGS